MPDTDEEDEDGAPPSADGDNAAGHGIAGMPATPGAPWLARGGRRPCPWAGPPRPVGPKGKRGRPFSFFLFSVFCFNLFCFVYITKHFIKIFN